MNTEEAVKVLRAGKSGVEEWNIWRTDAKLIPDLSGTNLSRCDLIGVDLHGLHLAGAFLGGSAMDRANLEGADFRRADMPACRLSHANLTAAVLHKAVLRGANLQGASLRHAELCDACVTHADFTDTDLRGANLDSVALSSTILHVAHSGDAKRSMRRADYLPLTEEVKDALFEILQKIDIQDYSSSKRQEVADRVDDLVKVLLSSPMNDSEAADSFHAIAEIAPDLVENVPNRIFTS